MVNPDCGVKQNAGISRGKVLEREKPRPLERHEGLKECRFMTPISNNNTTQNQTTTDRHLIKADGKNLFQVALQYLEQGFSIINPFDPPA